MTTLMPLLKPGIYQPRHNWTLALDSLALDEWFVQRLGTGMPSGLVPALGNLADPDESRLVWERMLPLPGRSEIAPVLICPEHLNLACAVVLVEILRLPGEIIWRRFGFSIGDMACPSEPLDVSWLPGFEPLSFETPDYLACLEHFHLLELDQSLRLDGKCLHILFGVFSGESRGLFKGTLRLRPQGLMLESERLSPLVLDRSWLARIRPVRQDWGGAFDGADFYLCVDDCRQPFL